LLRQILATATDYGIRTGYQGIFRRTASHIGFVTSGIASSSPHSLASSADANHRMRITSALPNHGTWKKGER
jgi:hypothetical protein